MYAPESLAFDYNLSGRQNILTYALNSYSELDDIFSYLTKNGEPKSEVRQFFDLWVFHLIGFIKKIYDIVDAVLTNLHILLKAIANKIGAYLHI